MKTFVDNAGRTWTVQVNVEAIKRVRELLSVNLLEVIDGDAEGKQGGQGKLLVRLENDPILLCDVVYVVCKPEADAKGVTDGDFGRAMAGDAIDAAVTALLEELVGFFPPGRRKLLAKVIAKLKAVETAALCAAEAKLDSPAMDRQIAKILSDLDGPADAASSAPLSPGT